MDNNGYINATLSTIKISETFSNDYSMAIGGNWVSSDGNVYDMIINETILSKLYCNNLIFESFNGAYQYEWCIRW